MKKNLLLLLLTCNVIITNAQTATTTNTLPTTGITSIASTTNAAFKLSINGTTKNYGVGDGTGAAATMVTSPTIFLQNTTATTGKQYSINSNNAGLFRISDAVGTTTFTATDRFVINPQGFIGIGNSAPTQILDVTGNINFSGALMASNNAGSTGMLLKSNGPGVAPTWIASDSWSTNGNVNANSSSFLGTTTDIDLVFKRNNVIAGMINSTSANTFIGVSSGQSNSTGNNNSFFGRNAGKNNTVGQYNNFIGVNAGSSNVNGGLNNFIGANCGVYNTSGSQNNFMGVNAGISNTTGNYNSFIGNEAGFSNTSGERNVFEGFQTGRSNTIGYANTFVGRYAGIDNVSGSSNTIIGHDIGRGITTGNGNTLIGANLFGLPSTLSNNIIIADGSGNRRINVNDIGYVGIGTITPNNKVEITQGTADNSGLRFTNLTSTSAASATTTKVLSVNANGDVILVQPQGAGIADGSETKVTAGSNVSISGSGTVSSPYQISATVPTIPAAQWISSSIGTGNIVNSNTGAVVIGSTVSALPAGYKLYVADGILAEKVKVALKSGSNWADFVFEKNYKLIPLKEVETFINKNKHLPGVQSADEIVKDGGIDVNKMFAKQMEKIEELTLYIIQQNKKIEALEKAVKSMK